jgi:hypothetical protein
LWLGTLFIGVLGSGVIVYKWKCDSIGVFIRISTFNSEFTLVLSGAALIVIQGRTVQHLTGSNSHSNVSPSICGSFSKLHIFCIVRSR